MKKRFLMEPPRALLMGAILGPVPRSGKHGVLPFRPWLLATSEPTCIEDASTRTVRGDLNILSRKPAAGFSHGKRDEP